EAPAPPPPPTLSAEERDALDTALGDLPVYFSINSHAVEAKEKAKIESAAGLLKEAEAPVGLVVKGVADNIGNAERNRVLSLQRADAVRRELVDLGIEEERIATESVTEDVSRIPRSERWK